MRDKSLKESEDRRLTARNQWLNNKNDQTIYFEKTATSLAEKFNECSRRRFEEIDNQVSTLREKNSKLKLKHDEISMKHFEDAESHYIS